MMDPDDKQALHREEVRQPMPSEGACPTCRGGGHTMGCCERYLPSGECCCAPEPVPCPDCEGSGTFHDHDPQPSGTGGLGDATMEGGPGKSAPTPPSESPEPRGKWTIYVCPQHGKVNNLRCPFQTCRQLCASVEVVEASTLTALEECLREAESRAEAFERGGLAAANALNDTGDLLEDAEARAEAAEREHAYLNDRIADRAYRDRQETERVVEAVREFVEELEARADDCVKQQKLANRNNPWRTAYAHREDANRLAAKDLRALLPDKEGGE